MIGFERDTKKSINFYNYNSLYEEWKEIVLPEIKKTKVYEKNSVKRRKERDKRRQWYCTFGRTEVYFYQ